MADLLTKLNKITLYVTRRNLTELCWDLFIYTISSKRADAWDVHKRNQFILFCRLCITAISTIYITKDTLEKQGAQDLNTLMNDELGRDQNTLQDYYYEMVNMDNGVLTDIDALIDEYFQIVFANDDSLICYVKNNFTASYLKNFITKVCALKLTNHTIK